MPAACWARGDPRARNVFAAQLATSQCTTAGSAPPVMEPASTSQAAGLGARNSATTATTASTSNTARSTAPT